MLKLLKLSAVLSAAAVIVSLPQTVFSRPLPESSGYPVVRNSERGSLFCYMRTPRGATLNLENLCRADDRSSSGNRVTNVPSNPAATTTPQRRVYTFVGTPGGDTNQNGANTGTNANPNGTNANANSNLNGTNTGTNNNLNGTNANANNNLNGTNSNANTNSGGLNTNANSGANGTNSNANTNPGGLNTNTNNPR